MKPECRNIRRPFCAADVIVIAQRHGFHVHSYADDTQLYFHDKAESCERRLPRFTKTLQSVLHSAARLIVRKRKFERITPTLRDDLHWLPVREKIVFKLCVIIFKCRHQTAPQYLQELCVPATASTSRRDLRSAARGDLQVLACRTTSFGPRSFAACAPKLWNCLPPSLRDPTLALTLFCSRLKTCIFSVRPTGAHL